MPTKLLTLHFPSYMHQMPNVYATHERYVRELSFQLSLNKDRWIQTDLHFV